MKKIVLFIAAAFIAVSCSDDDSSSARPINTDLLVGKWDFVMLTDNGTNIPLNDCDYGTWKEFKENGQLVEEYNCSGEIDTDTSTYTVTGTTITNVVAGDPDSPYVFEIKEVSEDVLILDHPYEDEDGNDHINRFTFNRIQE